MVGVIDPDPVARSGLRALLHRLGVDVSTYDSPEQAADRKPRHRNV